MTKGDAAMPLYFFRLNDRAGPPDTEGEEFADDAGALAFARKIEREVRRRKAGRLLRVLVFNADGKQVTAS